MDRYGERLSTSFGGVVFLFVAAIASVTAVLTAEAPLALPQCGASSSDFLAWQNAERQSNQHAFAVAVVVGALGSFFALVGLLSWLRVNRYVVAEQYARDLWSAIMAIETPARGESQELLHASVGKVLESRVVTDLVAQTIERRQLVAVRTIAVAAVVALAIVIVGTFRVLSDLEPIVAPEAQLGASVFAGGDEEARLDGIRMICRQEGGDAGLGAAVGTVGDAVESEPSAAGVDAGAGTDGGLEPDVDAGTVVDHTGG